MMPRLGIRGRALLIALVPSTLIAVVLGIYSTYARIADIERALDEEGERVVAQLAGSSEYGFFSENPAYMDSVAKSALEDEHVISARILDAQGFELAAVRRERDPREAMWMLLLLERWFGAEMQEDFSAPVRATVVDVETSLYDPPERNEADGILGHVSITVCRRAAMRQQLEVVSNTALIILAILIGTAVVALRASRSLTRPILRLTDTVRALEAGHLDRRSRMQLTTELGVLQRGINKLANTVQESQRDLERRVESATARLKRTNSELEQRNRELGEARRRADAASHAKSEFLANMSHEIRTPMNSIIGFTELLMHQQLPEAQREYVETLHHSAQRLLDLINSILDLSRIESGKLELDRRDFELMPVLESVTALLAVSAYDKGLRLNLVPYADLPTQVHGDPLRLAQVLTNLLGNAVKFTEQGHVTLRVMPEAVEDGRITLEFRIRDTGTGISRRDQQRIFEAFAQADGSARRNFEGSGLGLYISRSLIELMEGEIDFHTELGRGTEFRFTAVFDPAAGHAAPPAWPRLAGRRVLLCDRHADSRLALRNLLLSLGLRVEDCGAPDECPQPESLDPRDAFDVVILVDVLGCDPGNRQQMLRRLRALGRHNMAIEHTFDDTRFARIRELGIDTGVSAAARRERIAETLERLLGAGADSGPAAASPDRTHPRAGARHVLVVDDNPISRKLVITQLRELGVRATAATDGSDALATLERQRFDLVLLDLHMPGMDGRQTLSRIRENYPADRLPAVAITANALAPGEPDPRGPAFQDWLIKPATQADLAHVLEEQIGHRPPATEPAVPGRPGLPGELHELGCQELRENRRSLGEHRRCSAELARLAHRINGTASQLELPEVREVARELEGLAGRSRKHAECREAMARLEALIAEAVERLGCER